MVAVLLCIEMKDVCETIKCKQPHKCKTFRIGEKQIGDICKNQRQM